MNQEQVKSVLVQLYEGVPDFNVIFSGKTSRRVNGLYKPESFEIIIHNHNFNNDNELIYTAIHEFAHHVQFSTDDSLLKKHKRAHNSDFYHLFYILLEKAETLNFYHSNFKQDPDLAPVTETIQKKYLIASGSLMKNLGGLLLKAQSICKNKGYRFDDYLQRVLNIPMPSADLMIKSAAYDLNEELGMEKMKIVAKYNSPDQRESASKRLIQNDPIEKVKHTLKPQKMDDPLEKLIKEKERVETSIKRLTIYLNEIEEELTKSKKSTASSILSF